MANLLHLCRAEVSQLYERDTRLPHISLDFLCVVEQTISLCPWCFVQKIAMPSRTLALFLL